VTNFSDPKGFEWAGYAWMLVVLLIIPTIVGRAMGAPWREIGLAFAIIVGLAALFGLTSHQNSWEMKGAYTAIGFMIAVVPGVPILRFIMKLMGRFGGAG
jgi:hypothetical protein